MNLPVYLAIIVALAVAGFLTARWSLTLAIVALWAIGLAIAALAGAFHQTSEDTTGAQFFFAAWATMLWVLAFILGSIAGKALRWIGSQSRRRRPVHSTPATP